MSEVQTEQLVQSGSSSFASNSGSTSEAVQEYAVKFQVLLDKIFAECSLCADDDLSVSRLTSTVDGRAGLCMALDLSRGRMALPRSAYTQLADIVNQALTHINREEDFQSAKTLMQMSANFHFQDEGGDVKYLQENIKTHGIWKNIHYWDEAYFDALNSERIRAANELPRWSELDTFQQDDEMLRMRNIAFGQLGTFALNMLTFGNDVTNTKEFVLKQCRINDLSKEQVDSLIESIELIHSSLKCEAMEKEKQNVERIQKVRKDKWREQQRQQWLRNKNTRSRREVDDNEGPTINPAAPLARGSSMKVQTSTETCHNIDDSEIDKSPPSYVSATTSTAESDFDLDITPSSPNQKVTPLSQSPQPHTSFLFSSPSPSSSISSTSSSSVSRTGSFQISIESGRTEEILSGVSDDKGADFVPAVPGVSGFQSIGSSDDHLTGQVAVPTTASFMPDYSRSPTTSLGSETGDEDPRKKKRFLRQRKDAKKGKGDSSDPGYDQNELNKLKKEQWLQAKRKRWERAHQNLQFHMEHRQPSDEASDASPSLPSVVGNERPNVQAPTAKRAEKPHLFIVTELNQQEDADMTAGTKSSHYDEKTDCESFGTISESMLSFVKDLLVPDFEQ